MIVLASVAHFPVYRTCGLCVTSFVTISKRVWWSGLGMRKIVFELCAESIAGCIAARDGGADRIELCTGLSEDGLTPSHALITEAIRRSGLPVHVLLRPRGGDFVYSADEFALMRVDLLHAKELGAAGIVLGVLQADGS